MAESALVDAARLWVVDRYPYNSRHLLRTLEWLDVSDPTATEAARLAALTHDMERAFDGPDPPLSISLNDALYDVAHSERSARIVGRWLEATGADQSLVARVEALIRAHETGGNAEADLIQAVDSLSFLEINVGAFLGFGRKGKYGMDDIRLKFDRSFDRIRITSLRATARPLWEQACSRLETVRIELASRPA